MIQKKKKKKKEHSFTDKEILKSAEWYERQEVLFESCKTTEDTQRAISRVKWKLKVMVLAGIQTKYKLHQKGTRLS